MAKNEKAIYSDFNLSKLNTDELLKHLTATIQFGGNIGIFGRRGLGKTVISKTAIRELKMQELYLNISVLERVDLGGYPNLMSGAQKEKFVSYLMPNFYESLMEGDKEVVLLLDEVDKADPSLFAPLLELVQFRTINGRNLPNLKSVIMTGNLQAEGGTRPSLPLLDRCEKYMIETDAKHWLDWAGKSGTIHPSVTAYIADNPHDLFGDVDPGDIYADPSPRGWENASKLLDTGEKDNWSKEILATKVAGCVGKKVGLTYRQYFEHYNTVLPEVEEILKGKKPKKFESFEPGRKMVTCMILCARTSMLLDKSTKKDNVDGTLTNVGKFFQLVDPEMVLISLRSQIGIHRIIKHNIIQHPEWSGMISTLSKRAFG